MKVQHPSFPEIFREVEDIRPWLKAGWRKVPTSRPKRKTTKKK